MTTRNQRHEHVESRTRRKSHVRFGGRAGETHQPRGWKGTPVRPLHVLLDVVGDRVRRVRRRCVLASHRRLEGSTHHARQPRRRRVEHGRVDSTPYQPRRADLSQRRRVATNTPRSRTPTVSTSSTRCRRSAPSATASITQWPNRSTRSTRPNYTATPPRSPATVAPGVALMTSRSRRAYWSAGPTRNASTASSTTSRRRRSKLPTTVTSFRPTRPEKSNPTNTRQTQAESPSLPRRPHRRSTRRASPGPTCPSRRRAPSPT